MTMNDPEHYPLIDAIDHEILMHRDAHFGGLFGLMIDYYREEKKGVNPDFNLAKIERLAQLEKEMNQNLAPLFLSGSEAEKIGESRSVYKNLRDIYEVDNPKILYPRLIADLILSEDEDPVAEIQAIVKEKGAIVPSLLVVLKNEQFYDPLFPGYGFVPSLVARCLEEIGDKRALISLFEMLGQGDFFEDEQVIKALRAIGEPARDFLIRVAGAFPVTEDNERAVIALIEFKNDPLVSEKCLELLKKLDIQKDPCLPSYLVFCCEGLVASEKRAEFKAFMDNVNFSKETKRDIQSIVKEWEKKSING